MLRCASKKQMPKLHSLVQVGLLKEVSVGREKLFINTALWQVMADP